MNPRIELDYTGVTIAPQGEPENDWYQVMVELTTLKKSTNGDPQVEMVVKIIHGEKTGAAWMGKTLKTWVTFVPTPTGKSFGKFILKCLNQPHDDKFFLDPAAWLHQQLLVKVVQEERQWEGKTYVNAKIKGYKPLETSPAVPEDAEADPFQKP